MSLRYSKPLSLTVCPACLETSGVDEQTDNNYYSTIFSIAAQFYDKLLFYGVGNGKIEFLYCNHCRIRAMKHSANPFPWCILWKALFCIKAYDKAYRSISPRKIPPKLFKMDIRDGYSCFMQWLLAANKSTLETIHHPISQQWTIKG